MENKLINVYPGRKNLLRCYEMPELSFSDTVSMAAVAWHDKPLPLPKQGRFEQGLSRDACRLVNVVMRRLSGYEIFIWRSSIYLLCPGNTAPDWQEIDTKMLRLIKSVLWPAEAVEMWTQKELRP